jgi:outer membrane protein assembly factor BamB
MIRLSGRSRLQRRQVRARRGVPPSLLGGLGLAVLLIACSGADRQPVDRGLPVISSPVTFAVDWRIELVDNGVFVYAPTQIGRLAASPDGRLVYIGTSEGRFYGVHAYSGEIAWELELDEPVDSAPAVYDGTLYLGAADGNLYAVDARGGGVRWTYHSGGNLDSTPAVDEDHVVVATASGTIVCLDRATGTPRWTADDDDPVLRLTRGLHPPVKGQSSPTADGEFVYAGFPSGRVKALRLSDGVEEWTADLAGEATRHTDVDEPPVAFGDRLYASSFSGGLVALDRSNGNEIWRAPLRGATRPLIYRDHLLTTTVDGSFVSLDRVSGAIDFRLQLDTPAAGRAHLIGDYVVVPTTQGALYLLDASAPHIYARFEPTGGFASAVVTDDGRVVAMDDRGVLHGLRVHYQ